MIHELRILVLEDGLDSPLQVPWFCNFNLRCTRLTRGFSLSFFLGSFLFDTNIQIFEMNFETLGPLFDFDMMFIILPLCLLVVLLHSIKQLLLLCLDHWR